MQRESKIFQSIFDATRTGSYCFEIRTVSPCQTENYFLLFNFCASKSFEHFFFSYMNIWNKLPYRVRVESLTMIGQVSNFCNDEIRYVALRGTNNSWIRVSVWIGSSLLILDSWSRGPSQRRYDECWPNFSKSAILVRDHSAHEFHREKAIKSLKRK